MATLTATLTLASTDATSDALSLTVTNSLTTGNPATNLARAAVLHSGPTVLLASGSHATDTYFYIKNLDSSNFVQVKLDDATIFSRLRAGEWLFVNVKEALGVEVQADTATCQVEYGYWTNA
jgi:hypothetical protein